MFEELNKHKYLELEEIGEANEWDFRLIIAEADTIEGSPPVMPEQEPDDLVRKLLNESVPIKVTENSKRYEIVFNNYITYSVTNESYAIEGKDDQYEGKLVRIYTKSEFLNYIANSTFATSDYPGPFKHYGFCCLNHIIDVVSVVAPTIKVINA